MLTIAISNHRMQYLTFACNISPLHAISIYRLAMSNGGGAGGAPSGKHRQNAECTKYRDSSKTKEGERKILSCFLFAEEL
jgi:hypothetical protein